MNSNNPSPSFVNGLITTFGKVSANLAIVFSAIYYLKHFFFSMKVTEWTLTHTVFAYSSGTIVLGSCIWAIGRENFASASAFIRKTKSGEQKD